MAIIDIKENKYLIALSIINDAICAAFPDITCVSERAVLLEALVIADKNGCVNLDIWSTKSGISIPTLERYSKYFVSFGLMHPSESNGDSVFFVHSALSRFENAIESGVVH